MKHAVYLVTIDTFEAAQKLANVLLDRKLVACSNIIGNSANPITSVFNWQGKNSQDPEILLVMKSRVSLLDEIVKEVKLNHSYDVPEVIALPILGGNSDYLKWIDESTKEPEII